jgi:hypothetical protein
MSSSTSRSRRDAAEATNKSKISKRRQWGVKGFYFDTDFDQDTKSALKRRYPHSGGNTDIRTTIHGNVTHLFRYVYFFRRFYGNKSATATVGQYAVEDLALEDRKAWGHIFVLYSGARQACKSRGHGLIPINAPLSDQTLCIAVDKVLSMKPVNHHMSDFKQELNAQREKWKTIMGEWKKRHNVAEPYLPNGDNLLMELLEAPEDTVMEDAPPLVPDASTGTFEDNTAQLDPRLDPEVHQWLRETLNLVHFDPIMQAVQRLEYAYNHGYPCSYLLSSFW